jgi:hypothetical protein
VLSAVSQSPFNYLKMLPELPLLPTAQTTHDDLHGTISIDLPNGPQGLEALAQAAAVDTAVYLPVGLNLLWEQGQLHLYFHCLLRAAVDAPTGGPLVVQQVPGALNWKALAAVMEAVEIQVFDPTKALALFAWPGAGMPEAPVA